MEKLLRAREEANDIGSMFRSAYRRGAVATAISVSLIAPQAALASANSAAYQRSVMLGFSATGSSVISCKDAKGIVSECIAYSKGTKGDIICAKTDRGIGFQVSCKKADPKKTKWWKYPLFGAILAGSLFLSYKIATEDGRKR